MIKVFIGVLLMCVMAFWNKSLSQTAPYSVLQNVSPPSPEASSFARQNFADVNLYAGKHGYSIPLYTLSQNGINFPITLSYTGGGGIKVEEVASSVGLGWSLQYTGVITRSVRGVADDAYAGAYIGYIHLPGFDSTIFALSEDNPNPPNWSSYHDGYRYGKHDAQPDLYYVSAPGVSAMFYINKFKEVVFVEKSDLKIKIKFSGYRISGFDVTDLNGNMYVFDVFEMNRTIALNTPYFAEYNSEDASAWYLSKIVNPHGKIIFNFQYTEYNETVETKQVIRAPYQFTVDNPYQFLEDNSTYTELYNKRPLLQKITTLSGEVDFVMSQNTRYDLAMDRSIDSIIVKNYLGHPIRKFNFEYSYFAGSGVIEDGENQYAYGDPALRLKLNTLEIIGSDDVTKEAYEFTYDTNHLLPNRLTSFAMDHWGYFNGVTANTTWEAKHRELYYAFPGTFPTPPLVKLAEFGISNREPNSDYAQACILKEVTTPLGGKIQFEYEGNTSTNPELPNVVSQVFTVSTTPDNQKNYFSINMIREPFAYVRVTSPVGQDVSIEYTLGDSLENNPVIIDTLVAESSNHIHKFQNGSYYIKARIINYSPDPGYYYDLRMYRDIETPVLNKPVGGVRIKRMKLIDPASNQNYIRDYYYNEEGTPDTLSPSTGIISRVPKYGHQYVQLFGSDYIETGTTRLYATAHGYVRQFSSTYPLVASSGSYAGYSKVTTIDSDDLKSEYHYTTFSEFPQLADGYYTYTGTEMSNLEFTSGGGQLYGLPNSQWYEIYPFAPDDERDYFRGRLKKEIIYKRDSGIFKKISSKENKYIFNFGTAISKELVAIQPDSIIQSSAFLPDVYRLLPNEAIEGVIFSVPASCSGCSRFKRYRLHTGKYDLHKTIQKTFSYSGAQVDSLVVENTLEYGQAPWSRDSLYHYVVTKVIQKTNTGADTTLLYYPFDWRYNNPEIEVADTSFLRQLEKQNRIGMPFMEKKINDGMHVVTTKNLYNTFDDDQLYPNIIQVKHGLQSTFEERISFNKYDTLGNLIEQQKTSDVKLVYLWDYKASYPIAQVVNADSAHVAYTSFEAEGKGNWSFSGTPSIDTSAPTGKKSYSVNGSITKTGLGTSAAYMVSYWKKDGTITVNGTAGTAGESINGWTYYEHLIENPSGGIVTVSGSGSQIDELRLYPLNARMTTYTYEPLIGVTSNCDANNLTTYYHYDPMGRLYLVKDSKGRILKQNVYHHQTQTGQL